ncbi:MAG: carboxypeptidase-like regulatory domain-containing protein [Pyrinomonadaceae bacterium]
MTTTKSIRMRRIRDYCLGRFRQRLWLFAFCLILLPATLQAQTTLEMFANSYTGTPPNGPASTQTIQLMADPAPGTPPMTVVNVTATLSNQQFTGVGTGPGNPVVVFGGRRADGTTTMNTTPIFDQMNTVGSPVDTQFSSVSTGAPTGIAVADNHAFALYSSIQHWEGLGVPPTNSRTYVADLTLTFSAPVNNPYLHFVGMGGFIGPLGYATELDLTTAGVTLDKLQGNATLVVSGNQVNNGNATGILTNCSAETAGCGTVRATGTNITSLTFQLFIRGDGGAPTWSGPNRNEGDFWMLGVSLANGTTAADVSLSGRAARANGRGIGGARVTLIDSIGQIRTAITNPFGYYRFDGIEAGQTVVLSISSKQHIFANPVRTINLGDNAFDVNFVADN